MSAEMLGDDFRLYWDSVDTYDTPTWEQQLSVGSMGLDTANEQVEIPVRIPFKVYKKGRSDWSMTFTMNYDPTNDWHLAVMDSVTNGTKIHLAIADGAIATENYWHAWWFCSGPLDASLDSAASVEVEGKIHFDSGTDFDEPPAFVAATP